MKGIEINFVVTDSLEALKLYEQIFDVERIHGTNLSKGKNEVVFTIENTYFHVFDENEEFHLYAPVKDAPVPMWMNVLVSDIKNTYKKAIEAGCIEVQPVVVLSGYGVSNASFMDPYGYHWMLYQANDVISHEKRLKLWENNKK